jgi:rhomboid protease GluP
MNIVGCLDSINGVDITAEQLDNIAFQVERKFLLSGIRNINILFMIFSDDYDRDKKFADGKTKFWIIDVLVKKVIIFENQPDDFDGLRVGLENIINYSAENENVQNNRKTRNINRIPIVTITLALINIICFFVLEKNGSTTDVSYMLKKGAAYHYNIIEKHEYYRLLTCMFMHFGFAHLLNNMVALVLIGNEAELFYGRIKFLIIYMFSGVCGSIASTIYFHITNGLVVSAGASGAIYGILGSLVVKIVEEKKGKGYTIRKVILVLLMLFMVGQSTENVDNIAHIAGFVAGILSGLFIYRLSGKKKLEN